MALGNSSVKTLRSFIGSAYSSGDVGMELEVEAAVRLPSIENKYWTTKEDGSLRFIGREYVSNGPQKIGDVDEAVTSLMDKLEMDKECQLIPDSPRTSFHVHVNVLDFTHTQVINSLVAYWFFEPVLVPLMSKTRRGNCFCVPFEYAESVLENLSSVIQSKDPVMYVNNEQRYSSQNLASISRFGTIENRLMDGSFDRQTKIDWVKTLYNIAQKAKSFESPVSLLNSFYRADKGDLIGEYLCGSIQDSVFKNGRYVDLLESNEVVLNRFANRTKWARWQEATSGTSTAKKKIKTTSNTITDLNLNLNLNLNTVLDDESPTWIASTTSARATASGPPRARGI